MMIGATESWSTQQLIEFLASISSFEDVPAATRGAVERIAMALDAEIAAVVVDGAIAAAIGFPPAETPRDELLAVAEAHGGELEVAGLGTCKAAAVPMDDGVPGSILVGRFGEDAFTADELELLRGVGRVLSLSLRTLGLFEEERSLRETMQHQAEENSRLLVSLRERQVLIERLAQVERSIAMSTALPDVRDAIVAGAAELLGSQVAGLGLIAPDDPGRVELVSSVGIDDRLREVLRRAPVGLGVVAKGVEDGDPIVLEGHSGSVQALPDLAAAGLLAVVGAPVREGGEIVGSLIVGSHKADRTYSLSEQEVLIAFAEHAGLALNNARAAAETVHQAFHDSLTGLPNRALFFKRLEAALSARRDRSPVAVLFADLDGFKKVNDSLGHAAGDELLIMVAERFKGCLRPYDLVARFGGDEFAILVEGLEHGRGATEAAQRTLRELAAPFRVGEREVFINASIGIATGSEEPDHLLRNADLAMYQAKSRGKGRVELFEPDMYAAAVERLDLEVELRRAVEREEMILHFQPICRLTNGEILGVEALVRWQHPERGMVPPSDFIPLAEESGQILGLGSWVLREACRQAALWQARYPTEPRLQICVNVSGIQLEQAGFVDEVAAVLARSELEPGSLVLEITESALMSDLETNVRRLGELKTLGLLVAVDDFGTGYSSLEYLRRFPVDVLKIARPFVAGLDGAEEASALVKAVIELAESLGLTTVAEGIEHPDQLARLLELGCEVGQGFHFFGPADAEATDSLLLQAGMLGPQWGSGPTRSDQWAAEGMDSARRRV